jgi:hypothetical protein
MLKGPGKVFPVSLSIMKFSARFRQFTLLLLVLCSMPLMAEEDPFAFLNDDPDKIKPTTPEPGKPPTPNASSVTTEEELILRWKNFEGSVWQKLQKTFPVRRKTAAETLLKMAERATGAPKLAYEREAKRLLELPADANINVLGSDPQEDALMGYWRFDSEDKYHRTFYQSGNLQWDESVVWSWVDKEAGVLVQHSVGCDLLWLAKPGVIQGINDNGSKFSLTKSPEQTYFLTDPVLTKLAADEAKECRELETTLAAKRKLLAKFLKARADKMSDSALAKKIRSKADGFLAKNAPLMDHVEDLAGLWEWGGKSLKFAAAGRVVSADGVPMGTWMWGNGRRKTVMVVLDGGKSANSIFHANAPTAKDDMDVSVRALSGEKFRAKREL